MMCWFFFAIFLPVQTDKFSGYADVLVDFSLQMARKQVSFRRKITVLTSQDWLKWIKIFINLFNLIDKY